MRCNDKKYIFMPKFFMDCLKALRLPEQETKPAELIYDQEAIYLYVCHLRLWN